MATIWLVHLNRITAGHDLALGLIGDFAVRAFGSFQSFEQLVVMTKTLPDALVIDRSSHESIARTLQEKLLSLVPTVPVFILSPFSAGQQLTQSIQDHKCVLVDSAISTHDLSVLIRSTLRSGVNGQPGSRKKIRFQDIELDVDHNLLHFVESGLVETLTPKETRILATLVLAPGSSITRQDIKQNVWPNTKVSDRSIDSHISRIRSKLSSSRCAIESVYGAGYAIK